VTRSWRLSVAIALLLCACREAEDAAQTIVLVDAEPMAKRAIARLRVQAAGPMDHLEPTVETKKPDWPIKLVLAPKNDDASRRFTLHVEGRNEDDDRLMTIRLASGFVASQTRYAKLLIHDACVQHVASCKSGEVCNVWSMSVVADSLGHTADAPRKVDALCAIDDMIAGTAGSGGSGTTMSGDAAGAGATGGTGGSGASNQAGAAGQNGCQAGFTPRLAMCVDVDECQAGNPCGDHGRCRNTPGDYQCDCDPGYQNVSGVCMPSGGCSTNNGGCETTCQETPSGVQCSCAQDEWLKADRKSCGKFAPHAQINMGTSFQPTRPRFVFDPAGNGIAAWVQSDGMAPSLWTRRYAAGKGWDGPPMKFPLMPGGAPQDPRVALDAQGHGLMVWTQIESGDGDVWVSQYDGQHFSPPTRIDESSVGSATEPTVGLDANGDGFAAWSGSDGERSRIWVNRFTGGSWAGPQKIMTEESDQAFTPQLSVDAQGHALLLWTQSYVEDQSTPLFSPWTSRFDLGMNKWRPALELDKTGAAGYPDGQVFGSDGHAIAVWRRMEEGNIAIRASGFKGMAWSESVDISMGDSGFTTVQPRVAVSPAGDGAAVWAETHNQQVQVWANRYDGATAKWLGPMKLSSIDTTSPPSPQIAVDPNGEGFAVWAEAHDGSREIKAWRLSAATGFAGGVTLGTDMTPETPFNSPVQIAVDAQGNAIAIWDVWKDGSYTVWASTFE
jgi:Coagulation Factor Xa inhibitory site/Calcium-binding EGF domain